MNEDQNENLCSSNPVSSSIVAVHIVVASVSRAPVNNQKVAAGNLKSVILSLSLGNT